MSEQIWTIKDLIGWSQEYLRQAGCDTPRLDAELLLAQALSCRRLDLYLDHHKPIVPAERVVYRDYIKRRASGEPVAYIVQQKDFFGLSFKVDRSVLIPRPETELLVERVLAFIPPEASWRGLDCGTGSGCIAISIKKQRRNCQVSAWDVSPQALEMARSNALTLGADLELNVCDALDPTNWQTLKQSLDFIVSNPPYISQAERGELAPSVLHYEPQQALFAAEDGLGFYRFFAEQAGLALKPGGKIFLEVGYRQAHKVSSLLRENSWSNIEVHRDLSGHERVVVATLP